MPPDLWPVVAFVHVYGHAIGFAHTPIPFIYHFCVMQQTKNPLVNFVVF